MKFTSRERLMRTIRGESVDRPAVSFYEIDGYSQNPDDPSPFNIYNDPSWRPIIDLAKERSDSIFMAEVPFLDVPESPLDELISREKWNDQNGSLFIKTTIKAGKRSLIQVSRRDPDVDTVWVLEHFLKNLDDLKAYLSLPEVPIGGTPDIESIRKIEENIGDGGIVMLRNADPLCIAAQLFEMADYTIIAMTEQELFRQLMDRFAKEIYAKVELTARRLPGHLWRIVGPEYASPPYLPPYLFEEYVLGYDKQIVDIIHKHEGYARIHSHGRLKDVLDFIAKTGCMGLDPIEPPDQGDVELKYVREKYGEQMVLFGNLEATDLENLSTDKFAEKIKAALEEGVSSDGRGFVLMPSACPYGRKLNNNILPNYEKMIELAENFR